MKSDQSDWLSTMLIFLLQLSVSRSEKFNVVGPTAPVVVSPGEDTVLPCYLSPNISAELLEIRWFRENYDAPVCFYQNHTYNHDGQSPPYKGRAELFLDELPKGNVSLKLRDVRLSDNGQYNCLVESKQHYEDALIDLAIRAVSVSLYHTGGDQTWLLCTSEGWFSEPAVIWIDRNGKETTSLSNTTVERNSQGLFNVSSYIPVSQDSQILSCLVRSVSPELDWGSQLHIPRDFLPEPSGWMVTLFLTATVIAAASALLVFQWRRMDKEETLCIMKAISVLRGELDTVMCAPIPKSEWEYLRSAAADVTLDPDTAHYELTLSEDRKRVRWEEKQDVPDKAKRLGSGPCVLSREGFTSGRHYWEVEVTDLWRIGVTRESAERKGRFSFSPQCGYWVLECNSSHLRNQPRMVGVCVDIDERNVSFYTVESRTHIYKFTDMVFNQGEKIYPVFWTWDENKELVLLPLVSCGY
ncbi:butyrophilin subfamily 1 member A1-like [Lepisosteus oculatus]|uniref:Butyrophilin subfamily 1 member A1-like n=1 Tax=Lepisosteus oculatus TaxID=7918 RepID=W5MUI0_LEPOC|nr:PREDICTED: butyrophilin subfamily 1 member A1-like [Lepisosteus oculatus]